MLNYSLLPNIDGLSSTVVAVAASSSGEFRGSI